MKRIAMIFALLFAATTGFNAAAADSAPIITKTVTNKNAAVDAAVKKAAATTTPAPVAVASGGMGAGTIAGIVWGVAVVAAVASGGGSTGTTN